MATHHLVPGQSVTLAVAVGDPLVISMAGQGRSLPHPLTLLLREGSGGTIGAKFLSARGGTYEDLPGLESVSSASTVTQRSVKINSGLNAIKVTALVADGEVEVCPSA